MPHIPHSIFREYDIRGEYPTALNETNALWVGQALGSEIKMAGQSACFVAWDGRHSSPTLKDALIHGILSTGCDVHLIGPAPTAVAFWAIKEQQLSCAIITGSHNPKQDNGIKMAVAGKARCGEDIQVLYSRITQSLFHEGSGELYDAFHWLGDYEARLTHNLTLSRPLKVVVDAGNGIAGPSAVRVLEALGCELITIACEVDGDFPLHHPDPAKTKNLKWLRDAVLEHQADCGIALDGDGDRIGVIDEQGDVILPDRLSLLFVEDILQREANATILFDVKCTQLLPHTIQHHGGQWEMIATGHSTMKRAIKRTNAAFATELSGHLLFNDPAHANLGLGVDDGLYAAVRLIHLLSQSEHTLSSRFEHFEQTVSTEEIQIRVEEEAKFQLMQIITRHVFQDRDNIRVDGLRIPFRQGWALVRASNTTPCLTLRFEAQDKETLTRIQRETVAELERVLPNVNWQF